MSMHLVEPGPGSAPPQAATPEPWVDVRTVSQHLGWCPVTIAQMADSGRIPHVSYGNGKRKVRRFKLSAVDAALTQGGQ